jgi:hypothetical protein
MAIGHDQVLGLAPIPPFFPESSKDSRSTVEIMTPDLRAAGNTRPFQTRTPAWTTSVASSQWTPPRAVMRSSAALGPQEPRA